MEGKLIEKVREHECLFNIKCSSYRDQNVRNEAWEVIGIDLGVSSAVCKEIWAKLRNCYTNAMKRRRSNKSGQAIKKCALWKYEEQMSFLLPSIETRRQGKLEYFDTENVRVDNLEETNRSTNEQAGTDPPNTSLIEFGDEMASTSSAPYRGIVLDQRDKRKELKCMEDILNVMKYKASLRKERLDKMNSTADLDEVDMFYLSMAKVVKRLPPKVQANIRMEFCQLVSMAEIQQIQTSLHSPGS